ncbi:hypothetical protein [Paenibacillus odorifer]|uniref:Uncharacterized protein n=1 Tax=Paenibacillus odorifer TaxID=189426 RepID=A0AAD0KNR9_9BACL|nr:hypothetical protein [Paenibacillus odorifer]AWV35140.1 hypothetical protein CD191_22270 [Paenibacillus odorifer]
MIPKIDYGYSATLERLKEWMTNCGNHLGKNLNETETRNKIIDPLFISVMGWNEKQLSREGYLNKIGYYDYEFQSEEEKFILEAKRECVPFHMPNANVVKSTSLKNKYSELKEAISQGIDYAVPRSIDVVAVCNGSQIAVVYVPYYHTKECDTYLFKDHDRIFEDIINFYNLFSPNQSIKKELKKLLESKNNILIRSRPSFLQKINQKQQNPDDVLPNNQLATYLSTIHDKYFTEIISNWELLKKCYCDYEGAHQYEKNIEFVLRDRAPRLGKVVEDITIIDEDNDEWEKEQPVGPITTDKIVDIKTTRKTADAFDDRFTSYRNNSKMFLLIGGAGAGKTTFIHRFFNFILSEDDRNSTVWIYLDCKECASDTNLDTFIYQKIEDELFEKYSSLGIFDNKNTLLNVFANDIKRKKALLSLISEEQQNEKKFEIIEEIIEKDKQTYIKRLFEYIQKMEYSTCVVYDNVDQLDTELQKKLFLHGNAVKERLRTTLILSLREEVYYQHENDKTFNFSDCEVFHIPAPRIYNVLAKRLKAAKEELDESQMLFGIKNTKGMSITLKKLDIIEVLTQTFIGSQENTLLLEMLSNRDVRESLRMFKKIISSPNITYDDLLVAAGVSSIKAQSDKRIKNDELLKALALENRIHYQSSKSKIINIFDINNDGFFSHFTKLRILQYAQSNLTLTVGTLPKGFFQLKVMYNEFFRYTVNDLETFINICLSLQKEGALINLKGSISSLESSDFVSLGPTGYFYLNNLKLNPMYLALISIDAPITDENTVERIEDLYDKSKKAVSEFQKNKRYHDMANAYIDYLILSEKEEIEFLKSIGCPDIESPLYKISENIKDQINIGSE